MSISTKDTDGNVIKSVEYTYDIYGRRIQKVMDSDGAGANPAETEAYVYDGEHIALVFDGEGNQTHRYLHGPQIDQVLAEETADGEVRWALTDHQGSVRDVINNDGVILNHISYDSFGNITSETDAEVSFRFSYTGREFDEESSQYFYRARYYDAAIGRFINEDPIGFAGGDINLFRYVGNSPLNYTDPSGNIPFPLVALGMVGVGFLAESVFPQHLQAPTDPCDNFKPNFWQQNWWKRFLLEAAIDGGITSGSKILDDFARVGDDFRRAASDGFENSLKSLSNIDGGITSGSKILDDFARVGDDFRRAASDGFENSLKSLSKQTDGIGESAEQVRINRTTPGFKRAPLDVDNVTQFIPGSNQGLANRALRRSFHDEAQSLGFNVNYVNKGSSFVQGNTVYLNPKTATPGTLLDEYTHLFNRVHGRGTFLPEDLAKVHRQLESQVHRLGSTNDLGIVRNTLYHQLELQNFLNSGEKLPSFIRAIPPQEIDFFCR